MGIKHIEQTELWVIKRTTERIMGIDQTEQTEIWVLTRPNREKHGYRPDRTQRNIIVGQTKTWVTTKANRLNYMY